MNLIVHENYDEMSVAAAERIASIIQERPTATILPATGSTPMTAYADLSRMSDAGLLDASQVRVFQLDEYLGLAETDFRSLFAWTLRSLVAPLGIPRDRVRNLPGQAPDPDAACRDYDAAIEAAGGIDLAILGLGPNGHLGFNEPPSNLDAPSRVVELTPESITSNGPYWGGTDRVPPQALTAGMSVIRDARAVLLLVSGEHKRSILERTIRGEVTPDCPSTWLQRHPNVTVFADRAAAGYLPSDN